MSSVVSVTLTKLTIVIFGRSKINVIKYSTKLLALNAAFSAKGCTEVWNTSKHGDLPAKEKDASSEKENSAVKKNKECCGILVVSFAMNPSLNAITL